MQVWKIAWGLEGEITERSEGCLWMEGMDSLYGTRRRNLENGMRLIIGHHVDSFSFFRTEGRGGFQRRCEHL